MHQPTTKTLASPVVVRYKPTLTKRAPAQAQTFILADMNKPSTTIDIDRRIQDPAPMDWANFSLPDTRADQLNFGSLRDIWRTLKHVIGTRRPVDLPESVPGREWLPKYLLQEFHNLPNGNYSKKITHGYIVGFDRMMLGQMSSARRQLAQWLRGCRSALDIGCAGGRTTATLKAAGIDDVWGLEPSPYLLQHAARENPDIRFVQGLAENTGFAAERFDGVSVCFVFHEIPPRYLSRALTELNRVLKPGGKLAICEPSPRQISAGYREAFRLGGWRGVYFKLLAKGVHEPFIDAWHQQNLQQQLSTHGFELLIDQDRMPLRYFLARKLPTTTVA
jgi:ubiquinone/menaquinone biosynthesis C-methylase UbiE